MFLCTLILWLLALVALSSGTIITLRQKRKKTGATPTLPPVTILKPLKGVDPGLENNLRSFFALDYPSFELLFSVAQANDPAHFLVKKIAAEYPLIDCKIICGEKVIGPNPKVNNLVLSYAAARYEHLLISDSNTLVEKNYLREIVGAMDDSVGLVTAAIRGVSPQNFGGALESVYLNTFYIRSVNLAFACGQPCVIGKSLLVRKSDMEKFGGFKSLGNFLAEDHRIGEEILKLGKKAVLLHIPVSQYIGDYSAKDFWSRHIRWGRLRKCLAPVPFVLEFLLSFVFSALLGAIACAHYFALSPFLFLPLHAGTWLLADLLVLRSLRTPLSRQLLVAWVVRELSFIPFWLWVASSNEVNWRGTKLRVRYGGELVVQQDTLGIFAPSQASNGAFMELTNAS